MENKTDFLEEVGKVVGYGQEYANTQIELLKLEFTERLSSAVALVVVAILLGSIAAIVFTLLNVVLGLYLGSLLNNYIQAFMILAGGYLIIGIFLFLLRKPLLIRPIILSFFKK